MGKRSLGALIGMRCTKCLKFRYKGFLFLADRSTRLDLGGCLPPHYFDGLFRKLARQAESLSLSARVFSEMIPWKGLKLSQEQLAQQLSSTPISYKSCSDRKLRQIGLFCFTSTVGLGLLTHRRTLQMDQIQLSNLQRARLPKTKINDTFMHVTYYPMLSDQIR